MFWSSEGFSFQKELRNRKGGDSDFWWMFGADLVRFASNVPTRTSTVQGFDPGPTYVGQTRNRCFNGYKQLKTAGTCTQKPEPSMFTECFKQRSQLCSNRNFPIWLPVFYRKSYTIAGLIVLRSRLGHLITKAEFTRRVIWTQSNIKAEFIKLFMLTICHSE